jgi:poly(A) polymerase
MPLPRAAIVILDKVSQLLDRKGYQGYIVGGFIRDWLLGKWTGDVDIAVDRDALSVAQEVAQILHGKAVLLNDTDSIARVIVREQEPPASLQRQGPGRTEWHLDFASFSNGIEYDLARRDFTVDAMATELSQFVAAAAAETGGRRIPMKIIDPFAGEEDLNNGVLRAVSEGVFDADPARLLRGIRLAAELNFRVEPITEELIRHHAQSIVRTPGERIRDELLRLLDVPGSARYLRYLDELNVLPVLIPELSEGKGVTQPTVHFWDVFRHSLQTVAALEFLLGEGNWEYGGGDLLSDIPWPDSIHQHLSQEISRGGNRKALLKLGGLLHDIAKPRTKTIDASGRARFLGHTKEGAAMAENVMSRLRFSRQETNVVGSLVYHHLRPTQMANEAWPTRRAIYRYFRDTGDAAIDILILAMADHLATRGPLVKIEEWREHCQLTRYILAEHDEQLARVLPLKLLDGHELMDAFGLPPGPLIGRLLAMVSEAQASGELTSKDEALALARSELDRQREVIGTVS